MGTIGKIGIALASLSFLACNKDEPTGGMGETTLPESYQAKVTGSSPDGPIDSEFVVEKDDVINVEKISLKTSAEKDRLTIVINLPLAETESGTEESIALVVFTESSEDIWNLADTYNTYHNTLFAQHQKKAIIEYTIGADNDFYAHSLRRFEKGTVTLEREGDYLKGSFAGTLESDFGNGKVDVSGSFEANLKEDGLE